VALPLRAQLHVLTDVSSEEVQWSELAPLLHVDELVRNQVDVELVTAAHDDPWSECHRSDSGRQHGDDDDARAGTVSLGDVGEEMLCFR
jgi:hypothetical protein